MSPNADFDKCLHVERRDGIDVVVRVSVREYIKEVAGDAKSFALKANGNVFADDYVKLRADCWLIYVGLCDSNSDSVAKLIGRTFEGGDGRSKPENIRAIKIEAESAALDMARLSDGGERNGIAIRIFW